MRCLPLQCRREERCVEFTRPGGRPLKAIARNLKSPAGDARRERPARKFPSRIRAWTSCKLQSRCISSNSVDVTDFQQLPPKRLSNGRNRSGVLRRCSLRTCPANEKLSKMDMEPRRYSIAKSMENHPRRKVQLLPHLQQMHETWRSIRRRPKLTLCGKERMTSTSQWRYQYQYRQEMDGVIK